MMASTLQLEFSQAMSDFKKMFPDIDREVIEAVLRANQGAVDQTIDQLLAMSTDNQNEKLRNELDASSSSPQQSLINLNDSDRDVRRNVAQALQLQQLIDTADGNIKEQHATGGGVPFSSVLLNLSSTGASPNHQQQNTGASPKQRPLTAKKMPINWSGTHQVDKIVLASDAKTSARRWNPPMLGPLPPTFLRFTPTAGQQDFDLPDEQFALMLQNEEFMNQLRWNQEFMNALEKEQSTKAKGEDDAAFKERLKNMGKMSRKKFLQMARVFTWQRNKKVTTAKQIDSLPLKEEPSDDEEHHLHQNQQQQNQQQQHNQQQSTQSNQSTQGQGQLQLRK